VERRVPPQPAVPSVSCRLSRDLSYRPGATSNSFRLDVYAPRPTGRKYPSLLFVHGGGWRGGDKGNPFFVRQADSLAEQGFLVASINYRLSGEATFPAAIEDVKCAVRWMRAEGGRYGVDPERIGALGPSAGGHLVALLALADESAGFDGGPYAGYPSAVQAVAPVCPPTQLDAEDACSRPNFYRAASEFLGGDPRERIELSKRASPVYYVKKDAPPMLIIHGKDDQTVPFSQSRRLYEELLKARAPVELLAVEGAGHGVARSHEALVWPRITEFFRRHLM